MGNKYRMYTADKKVPVDIYDTSSGGRCRFSLIEIKGGNANHVSPLAIKTWEVVIIKKQHMPRFSPKNKRYTPLERSHKFKHSSLETILSFYFLPM